MTRSSRSTVRGRTQKKLGKKLGTPVRSGPWETGLPWKPSKTPPPPKKKTTVENRSVNNPNRIFHLVTRLKKKREKEFFFVNRLSIRNPVTNSVKLGKKQKTLSTSSGSAATEHIQPRNPVKTRYCGQPGMREGTKTETTR